MNIQDGVQSSQTSWSPPPAPTGAELQQFPYIRWTVAAIGAFFFFFKILFVCLFVFRDRGSEGEREGEKHRCERETLIGCLWYTPQLGTEATAQACALPWNPSDHLLVCGPTPNQLSHTSQGRPESSKKEEVWRGATPPTMS